MEYDWMQEATEIAAQCWCDKETSHIVMDSTLAMAVAKRIAGWMQTAAQNQRNTDYYRGLIVKCGESIGTEAFIDDEGCLTRDVLCAKVPQLVHELAKQ
jgi:hypothetical protein